MGYSYFIYLHEKNINLFYKEFADALGSHLVCMFYKIIQSISMSFVIVFWKLIIKSLGNITLEYTLFLGVFLLLA